MVDDAELMAEAEKLCVHFATAPTFGLGLIKRALDAAEDNDLATQLDLERDLQRKPAAPRLQGSGPRLSRQAQAGVHGKAVTLCPGHYMPARPFLR